MKIHIYLQARIGSTRLPGKILKKICGKSILQLLVERLRLVNNIDKIILVTGPENINSSVVNEAKRLEIDYFCGNEKNILDRFYKASLFFKSDIIIRITGDCPLIDVDLINQGLDIFSQKKYDILSINKIRTFPHGLDFEIFTQEALKKSWNEVRSKYLQEDEFSNDTIPPVIHMLNSQNLSNFDLVNNDNLSNIRLTLDYEEDFELIRKIYEILYINGEYFGLSKILSLLKQKPELLEINKKHAMY